jgi:hypothetical protein
MSIWLFTGCFEERCSSLRTLKGWFKWLKLESAIRKALRISPLRRCNNHERLQVALERWRSNVGYFFISACAIKVFRALMPLVLARAARFFSLSDLIA